MVGTFKESVPFRHGHGDGDNFVLDPGKQLIKHGQFHVKTYQTISNICKA